MIRSSKHSLKFSNPSKLETFHSFLKEYRRCASILIDYLWTHDYSWIYKDQEKIFSIKKNLLELPSMLTSDVIQKSGLETFLSGRVLKCLLTQIAGMISAEVELQRKRIFVLEKKKFENTPRKKLKHLIKSIKTNIPQKPSTENINPELNSICADFKFTEGEFNGFLKLKCLINTERGFHINLPIKFTKHSNKLHSKGGVMKPSFLINKNSVDIRWEIPDPVKVLDGKIVGADQGLKSVLTLSDSQVTPNTDIHGHSLDSILDKLSRKQKGSVKFKKAQDHRTNFINWSINQLNFNGIKQINLERIWNIGFRNKTSKKLSHWTNTLIRDKVESRCEELGVQVQHQDSTYRSQRCSGCGQVRKSNRKGKLYECMNCGFILDADLNAAKNHETLLPEIPRNLQKLRMNIGAGFYWLESGFYDSGGRSLQSLLSKKEVS